MIAFILITFDSVRHAAKIVPKPGMQQLIEQIRVGMHVSLLCDEYLRARTGTQPSQQPS
jgi:hypothetical protein